ncbi:MAG: accessory factor UbiK family protein [Gammaproteobacteria bacterium]|jgi:ubiquinone biosynthesis accessory factor UbiK
MLDSKQLDDLARQLAGMMPETVKTLQADVEKTLRAGLQGGLRKLDLVTREEFEVQSALLIRTREKLTALEKRVRELEEQQS